MVYVYVRSKKDFCITTNTPFQVQDLLTILNMEKNSKKCYWVTSTLILKNLKFPKVTKSLATSKKEF